MSTWRVLVGDNRVTLRTLAPESVQCCVTSPPYWGLRDYGHAGQLGLEQTPEAYVAGMVEVFREVRRVLRADGTLWLNIGDSYAANGTKNTGRNDGDGDYRLRTGGREGARHGYAAQQNRSQITLDSGLKPKDLVGIPWRLAFALQADGWYLRSDIIWHKPNPMPESVTDRPTKAHEYLFLLSRSERYYYDTDAIAEDAKMTPQRRYTASPLRRGVPGQSDHNGAKRIRGEPVREYDTRNARTVWTIATQPYGGAHFATFPPELAERCIKAGTSQRGACSECGAPWERQVEHGRVISTGGSENGRRPSCNAATDFKGGAMNCGEFVQREKITTGWAPSCGCNADVVPCVVLDPFGGSGTTGMVATGHGRSAILCELNPEYVPLIRERCGPMLEGAA